MGSPKLLLRLGEQTVIERLLGTLRVHQLESITIVVRREDAALAKQILAADPLVDLLQPERDPPQMRDSVELALKHLAERPGFSAADGWLLCPADHPVIEDDVLRQLLDAWREDPRRIVLPEFAGRRGHPTILPGEFIAEVFTLPADLGLNALVRRHEDRLHLVPVDTESVVADLDTPEDFARWQERFA